jgi:hypothetical protein
VAVKPAPGVEIVHVQGLIRQGVKRWRKVRRM